MKNYAIIFPMIVGAIVGIAGGMFLATFTSMYGDVSESKKNIAMLAMKVECINDKNGAFKVENDHMTCTVKTRSAKKGTVTTVYEAGQYNTWVGVPMTVDENTTK